MRERERERVSKLISGRVSVSRALIIAGTRPPPRCLLRLSEGPLRHARSSPDKSFLATFGTVLHHRETCDCVPLIVYRARTAVRVTSLRKKENGRSRTCKSLEPRLARYYIAEPSACLDIVSQSFVPEVSPSRQTPLQARWCSVCSNRNYYYLKPLEMRARISVVRFLGCLLLVAVVGTANTCAEPEPMARPTRPKAIASPEELERYFDLVRDYYSLRRAR